MNFTNSDFAPLHRGNLFGTRRIVRTDPAGLSFLRRILGNLEWQADIEPAAVASLTSHSRFLLTATSELKSPIPLFFDDLGLFLLGIFAV